MKKIIIIILIAFILIGCGSKEEKLNLKKDNFRTSQDIGKLNYENAMNELFKNDSVVSYKQIDSLYKIKREISIKTIYDE